MSRYDDRDKIEDLVGHKVLDIFVVGDDLQISTDRGVFTLVAQGDCCSWSYFVQDMIEGLDLIKGHEVLSIEGRDASEHDSDEGGECIQCYGYQINTAYGSCQFEMRNSSNGYYGGWFDASYVPN